MHRSRYYRNPSVYHSRNKLYPNRFMGVSHIRNIYKRPSAIPFFPSHIRGVKSTLYTSPQQKYPTPYFADRSKYVWTANSANNADKQSSQPQSQASSEGLTFAQPNRAALQSTQIASPRALIRGNSLQNSRKLIPLTVTALDPPTAVAKDIALKLNEEKVYLIYKVVDVVGVKKAIKLYYSTRNKENNGGILIQNGKRRRTPGGVFLTLLRESEFISSQEAGMVFQEIRKYELQMKVAHYFDG